MCLWSRVHQYTYEYICTCVPYVCTGYDLWYMHTSYVRNKCYENTAVRSARQMCALHSQQCIFLALHGLHVDLNPTSLLIPCDLTPKREYGPLNWLISRHVYPTNIISTSKTRSVRPGSSSSRRTGSVVTDCDTDQNECCMGYSYMYIRVRLESKSDD